MSTLTSVILAEATLRRVGAKYGLSAADLRILGAIALLSVGNRRPTHKSITTLLNITATSYVRKCIIHLVAGGYISKHQGHGVVQGTTLGLRMEPPGTLLVGVIEREDRAARGIAAGVECGRWKRKYVRKTALPRSQV